jgi:hypothetical protein
MVGIPKEESLRETVLVLTPQTPNKNDLENEKYCRVVVIREGSGALQILTRLILMNHTS